MSIHIESEKRFIWDDIQEKIIALGGSEQKNEKIQKRRRKSSVIDKSKIYCPHAYLKINFLDILNPSQKMKFRKYYYRKVSGSEPDIIILQDVKNLVMFLLTTPYYTEIWEEIVNMRAAITKKAPNPLAEDSRQRRAEELRLLRCLVAREYSELLLGCDEIENSSSMSSKLTNITSSQTEKELRIFEPFIAVAHRVIWIIMRRKYYHIIEVELHRLFRTDSYNTADKRTGHVINKGMLEEELGILYGTKSLPQRKLLQNSPLTRTLLSELIDFRVVTLGLINFQSKDARIIYLKNALLASEEEFSRFEIKLGILGHDRLNYDIMLVSIENENDMKKETAEGWERKQSSLSEKTTKRSISVQQEPAIVMKSYGSDPELLDTFPLDKAHQELTNYEIREESRKKWISRELIRQSYTYSDSISIATNTEI